MAMISVSVSAYNPHNHRFQGISGTRQMDGYQGPIMSLSCRMKELDIIDHLISQLAEKAFIFSEIIGKDKDLLEDFNGRFRFVTKYMHKYYRAKSQKTKSKKFPIMDADKIFLSIVELNKHPELKKKILDSNKLGIKESDITTSVNIVDKLLLLYERTLKKLQKVNRDFRTLQKTSYVPSEEDWDSVYRIRSRFWDFTNNVDLVSMNSMAEFVHERIQNKDLEYLMFRKLFRYYLRKETDYSIPRLSEKLSSEERSVILKKYKEDLIKRFDMIRSYLNKLTSDKSYKEKMLQAYDDEIIKSL